MPTMYVEKDDFFKGKIKLSTEIVGETTKCEIWIVAKGTEFEGVFPSFKWDVSVPFATKDTIRVLEELKNPKYELEGEAVTLSEQEENETFAFDEETNMEVTCGGCGKNYDEADVNIIDYELDLCVNCEEMHLIDKTTIK